MRQIARLSSPSVISVLLVLLACGTSNNNVGMVLHDGGGDGTNGIVAVCHPTSIDASVDSSGDTNAPVSHRATSACCSAERGPGPSGQPYLYCEATATVCPSPSATTCASDSECTSGVNGRCFPFEGQVGPGGCSYDECFTDSGCGARIPCICRGSSTDNNANVCDVGGNCAVDSDCGQDGYCSPSVQVVPNQMPNVCWGSAPYYCHTAADLCINDSDCPASDAGAPPFPPTYTCAYSPQDSRWECMQAVCAYP